MKSIARPYQRPSTGLWHGPKREYSLDKKTAKVPYFLAGGGLGRRGVALGSNSARRLKGGPCWGHAAVAAGLPELEFVDDFAVPAGTLPRSLYKEIQRSRSSGNWKQRLSDHRFGGTATQRRENESTDQGAEFLFIGVELRLTALSTCEAVAIP